jgi:hypothetical protein
MRLVHASPGDKIPAASCHLYLFPPPYHVMSREDRREDIFPDDVDRQDFLKTPAEAYARRPVPRSMRIV